MIASDRGRSSWRAWYQTRAPSASGVSTTMAIRHKTTRTVHTRHRRGLRRVGAFRVAGSSGTKDSGNSTSTVMVPLTLRETPRQVVQVHAPGHLFRSGQRGRVYAPPALPGS